MLDVLTLYMVTIGIGCLCFVAMLLILVYRDTQ